MMVAVQVRDGEHHLTGDWGGLALGNQFLMQLRARAFSPATVPAYCLRRDQPCPVPRGAEDRSDDGGTDGRLRLGGLAGRADARDDREGCLLAGSSDNNAAYPVGTQTCAALPSRQAVRNRAVTAWQASGGGPPPQVLRDPGQPPSDLRIP